MSIEEAEHVAGQLRAGIERVPAEVPPGLASRAYRRHRGRRAAARAIVAAGTAAVAAIGAAVAFSGPAAPATRNTAYVVGHVAQALDTVPAGTILHERMTYIPAGTGPGTDPITFWANSSRVRMEIFTPAGQLVSDWGSLTTPTAFSAVDVNYRAKVWSRTAGPGSNPVPADQLTCSSTSRHILVIFNPSEMVDLLRAEVSCGMLKADGTATVNGVSVIKLNVAMPHGTKTYWVSPTTYLPVRITVNRGAGAPVMQDDLQWLPPTAANVAELSFPVPPSGFTQVSR
jgi:hypothetical protein